MPAGRAVLVPQTPAVEERNSFAVRAEQHVVEPAGRIFHIRTVIQVGNFRHADHQFRSVVLEVNQPDAFIVGAVDFFIFVKCAGIAVSRTFAVQTGEIEAERPLAVGAETVDRAADGLLFAGFDIQNAGNEMVAFAVVVNHFGFGVVEPLEHAALLPAPGVGFRQRDEFVVVLQVDHAQNGFFAGNRLPCGEPDFL